jgi:hypothetical protein
MCAQCGAHYLGDKRSWTCAPCAYAEAETAADASEGDLTRDGWSEELTIQTDGSPCGTYLHIGDMIGPMIMDATKVVLTVTADEMMVADVTVFNGTTTRYGVRRIEWTGGYGRVITGEGEGSLKSSSADA